MPEGRVDAAEDAIEIVTIHSAKGLGWPVLIPINSTTELYRRDQFIHRQSDNTLHWMLGGVAPPDLAAARAEESEEEADQRVGFGMWPAPVPAIFWSFPSSRRLRRIRGSVRRSPTE